VNPPAPPPAKKRRNGWWMLLIPLVLVWPVVWVVVWVLLSPRSPAPAQGTTTAPRETR
jgi:hypothetical protein